MPACLGQKPCPIAAAATAAGYQILWNPAVVSVLRELA